MQSRITSDLVLDALLVAMWRRKTVSKVLMHSDQVGQYTSYDWSAFLRANGLESSINVLGNCHDNAVAESFFRLLNCERVKRKYFEHGKMPVPISLTI